MLVRYTEVYFNDKQKNRLIKKLTDKNFEMLSMCEWSETWVNPATEEEVVLVRG